VSLYFALLLLSQMCRDIKPEAVGRHVVGGYIDALHCVMLLPGYIISHTQRRLQLTGALANNTSMPITWL